MKTNQNVQLTRCSQRYVRYTWTFTIVKEVQPTTASYFIIFDWPGNYKKDSNLKISF